MRTFRVFVSSTFSDMDAEREALGDVFRRLDGLCREHGARFQAVDLRRGISDEAGRAQQTMDICLEEVQRSQTLSPRPNFLVLSGDRCGWHPLPGVLRAPIREAVVAWAKANGDRELHELVTSWYWRDDNAVPPHDGLQPRQGAFRDDREWGKVEARLASGLRAAARELDLPQADRLALEASATEQEVERGVFAAGPEGHAIAFIRTIDGTPSGPALARFFDVHDGVVDPAARERCRRTQERLRAALGPRVLEARARWTPDGITLDHLPALCAGVYEQLSEVIRAELADAPVAGEVEEERSAHARFGEERARYFVGRRAMLDRLGALADTADGAPCAVLGAPGSGKSALMARAVAELSARLPHAVVLQRFVGATPGSGSLHSLLAGLCRELASAYGRREEPTPEGSDDLVRLFHERLGLASSGRPLVVVLDGLDQLAADGEGASCAWLPAELPPHVRLLVSAVPDLSGALSAVVKPDHTLPMPPLDPAEADELLSNWLIHAHRTLQPEQRRHVLDRVAACPLPVYLKLVFEQARRWPSHAGTPSLGVDTAEVIDRLFDELSSDAEHGAVLVSRSMAYLAAARHGLSEDELLAVLGADPEVIRDQNVRAPHARPVTTFPPIAWARLFHDLAPYLSERQADGELVLTFFHRTFSAVAARRYLGGDAGRARHRTLAEHFGAEPVRLSGEDGRTRPNRRRASEWPFALARAGGWHELERALLSLPALQARIEGSGPGALLEDFDLVLQSPNLAEIDGQLVDLASLRRLREAVELSGHRLGREGGLLPGQLLARLPDRPAKLARLREQLAGWREEEWLLPLRSALRPAGGPLRATLTGHTGYVNGVGLLDGATAVSGANDGSLKLWDLIRARPVRSRWNAHSAPIRALAVHPAGAVVASGGQDRVVRTWTLPGLALLQTFEGHAGAVTALAISPDGRRIVSGSDDETLIVWDRESGARLATMRGHRGWVRGVTITPDGLLALSAGSDGTVRVFRLEDGAPEGRPLLGHRADVTAVSVTPDGRAVTTSEDRTLAVWDLSRRTLLSRLGGHAGPLLTVALTPDGRRAVTGGKDLNVRVWDLKMGLEEHVLSGHAGWPTAIAITPDGRLALSGSDDATIRIWNLRDLAGPAVALAVDARRSRALLCCDDRITVWDTQRGAELATTSAPPGGVSAATFEQEGRAALLACGDGWVRGWNLEGCVAPTNLVRTEMPPIAVGIDEARGGIAVACADGSVWACDQRGGQLTPLLSAEEAIARAMVFADGRVWIGCGDGCVKSIAPDARAVPAVLGRLGAAVTCLSVTEDGRLIAAGHADGGVSVWDVARGEEVARFTREETPFRTTVRAPGGGKVRVSSCASQAQNAPLSTGHTGAVIAVSLASDGSRVASCGRDRSLRLWDVAARREVVQVHATELGVSARLSRATGGNYVNSPADPPLAVAFDTTTDTVLTASRRGLQRWDMPKAKLRFSVPDATRNVTALALRPPAHALAASDDSTLRLWNLETGALELTIGVGVPVFGVAVDDTGRWAAFHSGDGRLRLRELAHPGEDLVLDGGHLEAIRCVGFLAGGVVATGSNTGHLRLWKMGQVGPVFDVHAGGEITALTCERRRGNVVAIVGGEARIWAMRGDRLEERWRLESALSEVVTAPAAGVLWGVARDGSKLFSWRLEDGAALHALSFWGDSCAAIAVTPDGGRLATAAEDGTIVLWNAPERRPIARYSIDDRATTVALSEAGDCLAAGDTSGHVHVWRLVGARSAFAP